MKIKERKTFALDEDELSKLNDIMSEKQMSLSETMRFLIRNFKTTESIIPEKKELKPSPKGYYVRLYKDDDLKLSEIASLKGVSVPQEIRYRISSTTGSNLFDLNEAKDLLSAAHEISKVGRLINQAIKERLLLGTKVTAELSVKIDDLDKAFKSLVINTMKRVK